MTKQRRKAQPRVKGTIQDRLRVANKAVAVSLASADKHNATSPQPSHSPLPHRPSSAESQPDVNGLGPLQELLKGSTVAERAAAQRAQRHAESQQQAEELLQASKVRSLSAANTKGDCVSNPSAT
jgi:hypothetical protein